MFENVIQYRFEYICNMLVITTGMLGLWCLFLECMFPIMTILQMYVCTYNFLVPRWDSNLAYLVCRILDSYICTNVCMYVCMYVCMTRLNNLKTLFSRFCTFWVLLNMNRF
jgi:hypothetical protein